MITRATLAAAFGMFACLVAWYGLELYSYQSKQVAANNRPGYSALDALDVKWMSSLRQQSGINGNNGDSSRETFHFWSIPAFDAMAHFSIEFNSETSAELRVQVFPFAHMGLAPTDEPESGHFRLTKTQIDRFRELMERHSFWSFESGADLPCTDGHTHVLEANRQGSRRVWIDRCGPSPAMEEIARFYAGLPQIAASRRVIAVSRYKQWSDSCWYPATCRDLK